MKKRYFIPALVVLAVLVAGCGGKYRHPVGSCLVRNGEYRVQVKVVRDKGVSETTGAKLLLDVCKQVLNNYSKS